MVPGRTPSMGIKLREVAGFDRIVPRVVVGAEQFHYTMSSAVANISTQRVPDKFSCSAIEPPLLLLCQLD